MSCSVKISSKGWANSQRRIGSLPEETSTVYPSQVTSGNIVTSVPTPTLMLNQQQQQQQLIKFGQTPRATSLKLVTAKKGEDTTKLLKYIDDNIIGKNGTFFGPFGRRKVIYCDYTTSGRSLQFLEEYIMKEVLPCLGDTRASTSICSLQSSLFRHEARDIVRHAVGASEQDAVLFTGHGTDDALRTLLRHLDLPHRRPTVVFVGPFEHHANLRPWREHGAKVVRITETKEGFLDLNDLERKLNEERMNDVIMVGCFNAASCITGVLADDVATTLMLHQYGALSVWDYTSAAPYVQINMNPHLPGVDETAVHKDAIIFSGHKFIGGAQSPGILVTKKSLLKNNIINSDIRDSHRHLRDPELRDESGTAGVVESIRCGLAVQLKESVTPQAIVTRQDKICKQVLAHVRTIPELILIGSGSNNIKRLPIFSFMVRHPRGTFLHHNFVCAILNDVFGIQARGGCACAGRYAHGLMGIDTDLAKKYESVLMARDSSSSREESTNAEALRPGFARLSLPYFMSESELAFVLEALKMVATEGWKLLPQYILNPETGEWRHHTNSVFKERKWLGSVRYTDGKMTASERRVSGAGNNVFPQSYSDCLQTARNIFNRARKMAHRYPLQIDRSVIFTERCEKLRWFILPGEAQDLLLGNSQNVKQELPFDPIMRKNHSRTIGEFNTIIHVPNQNNSSNISIRRLNSDIPRSGNPPMSTLTSPRHHSLPALSIDPPNSINEKSEINPADCFALRLAGQNTDDAQMSLNTDVFEMKSSLTGQSSENSGNVVSPPPVKFALGEAVTSSMILGTNPTITRLMSGEHIMPGNDADEINRLGRTRCNSLGSSNSAKTLPLPIPINPQTLINLGVTNPIKMPLSLTSTRNIRHCSCGSRNNLSCSLELDGGRSPTRSSPSSVTSSPTSSSSPSPHPYIYSPHQHQNHHHHQNHHGVSQDAPKLGRCSPILSSFSQSSEDDLRAYLKEVTKELATEIKSEIREVISKVDDVLSESNSVDTPQHHPYRTSSTSSNSEKSQQRDDSFSASEIAEYLMEFSKEMASEVKSEIRCMVNQVDGLGRFSPDLHSTNSICSTGYGTPERRLTSSPQVGHQLSKLTKINDVQQQHESKMSSECSSDETVIYVVGPKITTSTTAATAKAVGTSQRDGTKTSDEEEENVKQLAKNVIEKSTTTTKVLPEIYSAVNSVSSQDSGINLSFNESDIRPMDLGRTSSSSSSSGSSTESYGIINSCRRVRSLSGTMKRRERDEKLPEDDLSEDDDNDETIMMMKENTVPDILSSDDEDETIDVDEKERKKLVTEKLSNSFGPQWHSPTKNIWKPVVEAIQEFDMIRDKDRILICIPASSMAVEVATGEYSLALIHTLHQYQFYARSKNIDFEIGTVTIDAGDSYNSIVSMTYFKNLQIPYFYEEAKEQALLIDSNQIVGDYAQSSPAEYLSTGICSVCGHCGINMRKRLYSIAKRYGYNVLALGQHLDDFAEGFLSSLFYTGKLKTMKAHYYDKQNDVRVVRPFVYVRERALKQFTVEKKLPELKNICVACEEAAALKRQRNKELMMQQEKNYPKFYWSMRTALKPLILARGGHNFSSGHQRFRHKLKAKPSPSHLTIDTLATPKKLRGCESDSEQFN